MVRVLYDHQVFSFQRVGGISRYICEIIKNRPQTVEYCLSGLLSNNIYAKEYNLKQFTPAFPNKKFTGKDRIVDIPNKLDSIAHCIRGKYDILHPTYYDPYFLKFNKRPFVITVHDMIHERYPAYFEKERHIVGYKKLVLQRADAIIAISENTKRDILQFYPWLNPDKIVVIYHGNTLVDSSAIKPLSDFPTNYLLYTGERGRYKNFKILLHSAREQLLSNNLYLVCTGSPFNQEEQNLISSLELSDRVVNRFVNELELKSLYKYAIAFIFPSHYEGFGIPVLEAFNYGCPAILSNASSLPEVGGDAALYFDPNSAEELTNAIDKVVHDKELRSELINKGRERVKQFTWENTARQTAVVYNSLI